MDRHTEIQTEVIVILFRVVFATDKEWENLKKIISIISFFVFSRNTEEEIS